MGARLGTAVAGACLVALMVAAPSAHAAFPGANGKIAFSKTSGQGSQIYVMNPDGTGTVQLTHAPGRNYWPAWSPDGRGIAFTTTRDDPDPEGCRVRTPPCNEEIYVMDAVGANQTRLTNDPADDLEPTWSPDGTKIAFSSNRAGDWNIYSMNADGSGVTRLTFGRFDFAPAWSPDGARIAFGSQDQTTYDDEIVTINPDGSNRVNLTNDPNYAESQPDWSPDGRMIAYLQDGCGYSTECISEFGYVNELQTMRSDGTQQTYVPYTGFVYRPVWSPDGSRIALSALGNCTFTPFMRCNSTDVVTHNPDGSGRTNLTNNPAGTSSFDPSWQPIPNRPPDCAGVAASPDTLRPPNHKLVPASLSGATDPDGDQVTLTITGVRQDEPRGSSPNATLGPAANQVSLRAERDGGGNGRVYRIAFTASDGKGGSCSGVATVGVPHNGATPAVDSAPPSYDSFGR